MKFLVKGVVRWRGWVYGVGFYEVIGVSFVYIEGFRLRG